MNSLMSLNCWYKKQAEICAVHYDPAKAIINKYTIKTLKTASGRFRASHFHHDPGISTISRLQEYAGPASEDSAVPLRLPYAKH